MRMGRFEKAVVSMYGLRQTFCGLVAMCLLMGCTRHDPDVVPIAGRVVMDGKAIDGGTIRFVPKVGRPASSEITAAGEFRLSSESIDKISLPGVPPGTYRVQVSHSEIVDDQTIHWTVPQRYADFRTSGLRVTVAEPTDNLVIELDSQESRNDAKKSSELKMEAVDSEGTTS